MFFRLKLCLKVPMHQTLFHELPFIDLGRQESGSAIMCKEVLSRCGRQESNLPSCMVCSFAGTFA